MKKGSGRGSHRSFTRKKSPRKNLILQLTRRQVLTGSAIVAMASAVSAQTEKPIVSASGGILSVKYAGTTWSLDAKALFGRDTQVTAPRATYPKILLTNARLPGITLKLDFEAHLQPISGDWRIHIRFKELGLPSVDLPLLDWMAGRTAVAGRIRSRTIKLGWRISGNTDAELLLSGETQATVSSDMTVTLSRLAAPLRLKLSRGEIDLETATLEVKNNRSKALQDALTIAEKGPTSQVAMTGRVVDKLKLGNLAISGDVPRRADITANQINVTFEGAGDSRESSDLHDGLLWLRTTTNSGAALRISTEADIQNGRAGTGFFFDSLECHTLSSRIQIIDVVGQLARSQNNFQPLDDWYDHGRFDSARSLESESLSIAIVGRTESDADFRYQFLNDNKRPLEFRASLCRAHVAVPGASSADLAFPADHPIVIRFGQPDAVPPGKQAALYINAKPSFLTPLENARLRLRRSADLFDLSYGFVHYELQVQSGKAELVHRVPKGQQPILIVHFPPQHVFEEAINAGEVLTNVQGQPPAVQEANCCRPADPVRRSISDAYLTKTRISGPTRLVFRDTTADPAKPRHDLTIDYLTDWANMALEVSERMGRGDLTVDKQIETLGIKSNTSTADAKKLILDDIRRPSDLQTAIEAPFRLILSPDQTAFWKTRRRLPGAAATEIWSTDLDQSPTTKATVRALWARDFSDYYIRDPSKMPAESVNFVGSMTGEDRREIVGLTSVYGLPALRRLYWKNPKTPTDDPAGMVVMPEVQYDYMEQHLYPEQAGTTPQVPQVGIVVPKPFTNAELNLSSRGATFSLRWQGEPPAADTMPRNSVDKLAFFKAYTIERYVHRASRGRDVFVDVTYKGFLFPFGYRAALVKLSERKYFPWIGNKEAIDPTAYLAQRIYIVTPKPDKQFPALNQPFASRDFSPKRLQLVTVQTPDLTDPVTIPALDVNKIPGQDCRPLVGKVFWPQFVDNTVPPSKALDVQFEFLLDDDSSIARSPAIFMDNAAVHDPETVSKVVAYYNTLGVPDPQAPNDPNEALHLAKRTMGHDGVTRRYADAGKPGDTSFQTYTWTLAARGKGDSANFTKGNFSMDATMEGMDQPPFYPWIAKGLVVAQPLERLLGTANRKLEVGFNRTYRDSGFDPANNPGEVYLDVLTTGIYLDASDSGGAVGGVARPNAALAALSRKLGVVGGRRSVETAPADGGLKFGALALAPASASGEEKRPFDIKSLMQGQFDPLEFFGGALKDAKLLGIIPLRDVIRTAIAAAAPKLREKAAHTMAGFGEKKDEILKGMQRELPPIAREIASKVDEAIATANKALADSGLGANVGELYPDLNKALVDLRNQARAVAEEAGTAGEDKLYDLVSDFYTRGKGLLEAIEGVVRNPVPPLLGKWLNVIRGYKAQIEGIFADPTALLKTIQDQLQNIVLDQLSKDLAASHTFAAVFGRIDLDDAPYDWRTFPQIPPPQDADPVAIRATLKRLFSDPGRSLPRLQEALFFGVLTGPLSGVLSGAQAIRNEITATLAWARRAVVERTIGAIRKAAQEIAKLDPAVADAIRHERLDEMVWRIVETIESRFSGLDLTNLGADPIKTIMTRVEAASGDVLVIIKEAGDSASTWATEIVHETIIGPLKQQHDEFEKSQDFVAAESVAIKLARLYQSAEAFRKLGDAIRKDPNAFFKIVKPLLFRAVEDEVRSALVLYEAQARQKLEGVSKTLVERLVGLAGGWLQVFERLLVLANAEEIAKNMGDWCETTASKPAAIVTIGKQLADGLLGRFDLEVDNLTRALNKVATGIEQLALPETVPSEARGRLLEAKAALRRSMQTVSEALDGLQRIRLTVRGEVQQGLADAEIWGMKAQNVCLHLDKLLVPIGGTFELRRKLCAALYDTLSNAAVIRDALAAADPQTLNRTKERVLVYDIAEIRAQLGDVAGSVIELLKQATSIGKVMSSDTSWSTLKAQLAPLSANASAIGSEVKGIIADIEHVAKEIEGTFTSLPNPAADPEGYFRAAAAIAQRVSAYTSDYDRKLAALAMETVGIPKDSIDALLNGAKPIVLTICAIAKTAHETVAKVLTPLIDLLTKPTSDALASLLRHLLSKGLADRLIEAKTQLDQDYKLLDDFEKAVNQSDLAAAQQHIKTLTARWRSEPGLVLSVRVVREITNAVLKGQIGAIFDFRQLKHQLEAQLARLLPARFDLNYDWDSEVGQFPESDPVFAIDRTADFQATENKDDTVNDLVLRTKVSVNVLTGERNVSAVGHLRPFKLRLMGSRMDFATIYFKGATFSATDGGSKFSADVARVEIGPLLKFLEPLQKIMSPSKDNGFYAYPSLAPQELVVGYKFSKPFLNMAALDFFNIAVDVGAKLPLDNREAEIYFKFASRANPFLIARQPYGGGGFVGLQANAKSLTAFEIMLEFGAVVGINFGPLNASGRITAGIYLMGRQGGDRTLEGFVHAVGEGNIACFGISVNIEVGTKQTGEGAMEGYSSYSFTFSVGFFDVSYSFDAHYKTEGGSGGGEGKSLVENRDLFAGVRNLAFLPGATSTAPAPKRPVRTRSNVANKATDWRAYRKYVDLDA